MKNAAVFLVATALSAGAIAASAQDSNSNSAPKPPDHFYRLNLVVQETNEAGKVTNERTFVTVVETTKDFPQSIRSDDRVPILTTSDPSQYQRVDLGIDFDIRDVKEPGDALSFRLGMSANTVANAESSDSAAASVPTYVRTVLRQNKWDTGVLIPIGKPTVAFSADRLEGKGKMQVVVTATRVD
jgi:hypothetical protein